MSKAIIITGMHRSGTSALTRVLNLMGVELGNNLISPAEDNIKGFWEHKEVVGINERLLNSMGVQHLDPNMLPKDWVLNDTYFKFKNEIEEVIERDFTDCELWGVKDPRISRLVPIWLDALEKKHEINFVISIRDPMEVAESLKKRNGLSISTGLILWLRYNMELEKRTRSFKRVFIYYPDLLSSYEKTIKKISKNLSIDFPVAVSDVKSEVEEFIDDKLRHHKANDAPKLISEYFNMLIKAVNNKFDYDKLDMIYANIDLIQEAIEDIYREKQRNFDEILAFKEQMIQDLQKITNKSLVKKIKDMLSMPFIK